MGGAKKKSLAQAEKQQNLQSQKEEKQQDKKKSTKQIEKKISGIDISNIKEKELDAELVKIKAITPYTIATRYNLKLSIAKDFLESLEKLGKIHQIAGNSNLRVYKFGSSPA